MLYKCNAIVLWVLITQHIFYKGGFYECGKGICHNFIIYSDDAKEGMKE